MAFTVTTTEADLALSKIIERRAAGISLHAISIQPTRNLHTLLYGDNITMKPHRARHFYTRFQTPLLTDSPGLAYALSDGVRHIC